MDSSEQELRGLLQGALVAHIRHWASATPEYCALRSRVTGQDSDETHEFLSRIIAISPDVTRFMTLSYVEVVPGTTEPVRASAGPHIHLDTASLEPSLGTIELATLTAAMDPERAVTAFVPFEDYAEAGRRAHNRFEVGLARRYIERVETWRWRRVMARARP